MIALERSTDVWLFIYAPDARILEPWSARRPLRRSQNQSETLSLKRFLLFCYGTGSKSLWSAPTSLLNAQSALRL